ncbi:MAG: ATP-binding cassette domain-containing protein, partial [Acidimicrobiales bacterium]
MLDGLDLDVPAGRFVAILGPSGCGKSTLLRLLAGLVEVQAGSISIGGRTPGEAGTAKRVGLVPQTP